MKTRRLLVFTMATFLVMTLSANISLAQATAEKSSPVPMMQSPASTSAHPGEWWRHHGHKFSLKAIMEKLGITDAQKKQFRSLYAAFADQTRKTRMDLKSLKDEKKTMLLSGKIDQQKLSQIDDQFAKLKAEMIKARLKLQRDRLALLTPEQTDKVADWLAQKEFHKEMRGMHKKHGREL